MRASSPSPGARAGARGSPGPSSSSPVVAVPSWPALAHKARLLFAQWAAAAADARRALLVADHVRERLGLLFLQEDGDSNPWSACGQSLSNSTSTSVRNRVIDAHLRDVEEELRRAAAARGAMADSARALGRLAASAATGAAGLSASALSALERQLAPGPKPYEVAEHVQDLWRACAAETQLHEAAAARCALLPAGDGRGGSAATTAAPWSAALAVLEAEVNVDRARFEAFFDNVHQAWPS